GAVDGDEPERGPVAERPLEVVHRAPVGVAAQVDAVAEAAQHAPEGTLDVGDAAGVVVGADAVLGDEHGRLLGDLPRAADRRLERLWPELVAHDRRLDAL